MLTTRFYNKYRLILNVDTNPLTPQAKLSEIYAANREIVTDSPIAESKGVKIALNPSFGNADPILEALSPSTPTKQSGQNPKTGKTWTTKVSESDVHLATGTPVTLAKDFELHEAKNTSNQWETIDVEIQKTNIPIGTQYIGLQIKNKTSQPILIKDVKIRKKKAEKPNVE